jgi:hypothetical protein
VIAIYHTNAAWTAVVFFVRPNEEVVQQFQRRSMNAFFVAKSFKLKNNTKVTLLTHRKQTATVLEHLKCHAARHDPATFPHLRHHNVKVPTIRTMRFPILTLLLVVALASCFVNGRITDTKNHCRIHSPKVYQAVTTFCKNIHLTVPSKYGNKGKWDGTRRARATIEAKCKPVQWIPGTVCRAQFYNMCAHRTRKAKYGAKGCQTWVSDAILVFLRGR